MPKFFDRIVLDIIIILTTWMWASYLIKNTIWVVVLTVSVYLFAKVLYLFLFNRYRNQKVPTQSEMEFLLSIKTPDEQAKFLLKTLPESAVLWRENNCFCIVLENKPTLVFCFYKFVPISGEDIARAFRTASEKEVFTLYFIGRLPTRQTMLLTRRLSLEAHFVTALQLKRFLIKHNAMPEPIAVRQISVKKRVSVHAILHEIFSPRRAKYFAASGIALALICIFTPLKLYYLILSSISFTIAAVSILLQKFYN